MCVLHLRNESALVKSLRTRLILGGLITVLVVGTSACSGGLEEEGEVERPLYPGTRTEFQIALIECAQGKGIDIEAQLSDDGDGYEGLQHSEERPEEVAPLFDLCREEIGYPPPVPSSDEEIRVQFDWRVGEYECLIAAGFDVPEPPSFAAYLEESRGNGDVWNPWYVIEQPIPKAALKACPRDADTWWR